MISVLWYHKPPQEKQIDGTYWMHWKADMCQLKREFRELKRLRKEIGESCLDSVLVFLFEVLFLHFPMLILNAIATSYLVWRIFAFRFGFIKDLSTTKKNGWCKRRKSRWKKGAASPYQVHAVALNIDDRVSNTSSVRFDADSLTVICNNSDNAPSVTINVALLEILK